MDFLRKNGLWFAAAAIFAGAVVFYMSLVLPQAGGNELAKKEARERQSELTSLANQGSRTVGPEWIKAAREQNAIFQAQFEDIRNLLARQPRRCQTRWFYNNEYADTIERREVREYLPWRDIYQREQAELRNIVADNKIAMIFRGWGTSLPKKWEIQEEQTRFWFQKDMAVLLTYHEPALIQKMLDIRRNVDPSLTDLFSVTRNKNYITLKGMLEKLDKRLLAAVLAGDANNSDGILTAYDGCDLQVILGRFKIADGESLWSSVYNISLSEAQRAFLSTLEGDDRASLRDFIMYLRTVRFRDDLKGIYRRHQDKYQAIDAILKYLDQPTREQFNEMRTEILNADAGALAEIIAWTISIQDEKDYQRILESHKPPVVYLDFKWVDPPWPYVTAPTNAEYLSFPFSLTVEMEFSKFPVLWHRLMRSDWRLAINSFSLARSSRTGADLAGAAIAGKDEAEFKAPPQNLAQIQLGGEARLFLPLWKMAADKKDVELIPPLE